MTISGHETFLQLFFGFILEFYRRNRRHSVAPDDPGLMFSRNRSVRSTAPSRPAICRRNTSAFSKRSSAILLLVEIIQFVAVNAHDKA